ncbi:MAG: 30S ribosomal protein S6, partial [Candidatus Hydrogenedentes bacterium]|nr:30S ribosomal protein S6 [Candidatus Hydrogenedentota bacterium]
TYEALYIVRPDLKDDEIQTVAKEVENLVTANGGTIVRSETWGKRKLAYEVKKYTEGVYILLRFESTAEFAARLETHFRLSENIIRDLIVYFDPQTLRLEEEQKQRVEAEIRASAARERNREDDDDEDDDRRPSRGRRRDDDDDDD